MKRSEPSSSRLSVPGYSPSSRSKDQASPGGSPGLPPVTRSYSHLSTDFSVPSTPLLTPQGSSISVPQIHNAHARRLLMPTVRSTRSATGSPKIPNVKASPSKMSRSRAGSVTNTAVSDYSDRSSTLSTVDWVGGGRKFEILEEEIELLGYQIYAVERWVVERRRSVIVLTVFTGEPKDKIVVTALRPQSSLSQAETQIEWEQAIRHLRRDGARPKETPKGTIMVTSLANFRSDYTIVHIPRGNFLDVREQLYMKINLLRMGSSGRSGLTLEEPSDATKDRFILMYQIPDKARARSAALFNATVLEFIKIIQAALAIFDMFDIAPEERNGLLCDVTCEGLKRWAKEIGEPCMQIGLVERVLDPAVVAGLLSTVLAIRNKLHVLGYYVPKDPFLDPLSFSRALTGFHSSKSHSHGHSHSHPFGSSHPTRPSSPTLNANTSPKLTSATPDVSPVPPVAFLSQQLVESIQQAYEKKARSNESYKVHRVLINKLDDLAADLRTGTGADGETGTSGSSCRATTDLSEFVKIIMGNPKDAPYSLRYLWTGRPDEVDKKRREKESVWSDVEREREDRGREKDPDKSNRRDVRDRSGREYSRDRDVKSSGDESDSKPWSSRKMQRKIESWAALGRTKKPSVDLSALGKSNSRGQSELSGPPSAVPSVRITADLDDGDVLSSGQVSPIVESLAPFSLGVGTIPPAQRSASELSDYDRRVTEFNQKRPPVRPSYPSRIISWSDPISAKELFVEDDDNKEKDQVHTITVRTPESAESDTEGAVSDTEMKAPYRRKRALGPRRCRSFDEALSPPPDVRVLPIDRMRIDVELCGQLLVMHRRARHLANLAACLAALTGRLSGTNSALRAAHEAARPALDALRERAAVLHQVEAARSRADALTQETNALAYESAQFLLDELWHMAVQPRRRVLALRERVFGTGRRVPQGVRGAHGRFDRVQWTLDGEERLVDVLGRTESEAEEEQSFEGEEIETVEEIEEAHTVQNQTLRPTWLLNIFNYFGSRWGASKLGGADKETVPPSESETTPEQAATTSLPTSPVQPRQRPSARHTQTTG